MTICPPEKKFKFAECIRKNHNVKLLTLGKFYKIVATTDFATGAPAYVKVRNDKGWMDFYAANNFMFYYQLPSEVTI